MQNWPAMSQKFVKSKANLIMNFNEKSAASNQIEQNKVSTIYLFYYTGYL